MGNIDLVKQLNSAAVHRLIDQHGPTSRIQIAEQSQLTPASVTKITRQLIEREPIKEVDQQASTGGHRTISIVTETRNLRTIGVHLDRHDTTLTLYDMSNKVVAKEHHPFPERTQEMLEYVLFNAIAIFTENCQRKIRELIAISVILLGPVDPESGVIRYTSYIQAESWGLVEALEERFKVTCFAGHDIRSLTLTEHHFGTDQDCEDSILMRVHHGIGVGIIPNGRIFIGHNSNVDEIGYIQVEPPGECHHYGSLSCLKTIAANTSIEYRVQSLLKQGYPSRLTLGDCSIKVVCKVANKGGNLAAEVIEHIDRRLGKIIAIAINLSNPQKIVIAGEITEAGEVLLPAIENCINTQASKVFHRDLPVVYSTLNHRSAIGASALVKHAMLNNILLQRLLENQYAPSFELSPRQLHLFTPVTYFSKLQGSINLPP